MNEILNIDRIYRQTKQRVDLEIDFYNKSKNIPVKALTKLYFELTESDISSIKENLLSFLHNDKKSSSIIIPTEIAKGVITNKNPINPMNINIDLSGENNNKPDFEIKSSNITFEVTLHCDNMIIESVELVKYSNEESTVVQNTPNQPNKKQTPLANQSVCLNYKHLDIHNQSAYFRDVFLPGKDADTFRNINRLLYEKTIENGNLKIYLPIKSLLKQQAKSKKNETAVEELLEKFKIIIKYRIVSFVSGLHYQNFFNEKLDNTYEIIYTSNTYFNTPFWVPCLYDLKSTLKWKLFVLTGPSNTVYSSITLKLALNNTLKNQRLFYFESNSYENFNPKNVGFALTSSDFARFNDPNNNAIQYIVNESLKEKIEKSLIETGVIQTIYSFYEEFFEAETPLNLNNMCSLVILPYLSNVNYTRKLNLDLKDDYYLDIIKFPNLYIIPEKLIVNDKVPDLINYQLRKLSTIFIYNFIGGLLHERDFSDFWLIAGLESWLSYCFMQKCNGNLYVKNLFLEKMRIYKKHVKHGTEFRPLYSNNFFHPLELQVCPVLYLKSFLVILLLENYVERIFLQKAIKNFINESNKEKDKAAKGLSTEYFLKTLKKNCGISLMRFLNLWVKKTGMLSLKLFYKYIEDNNSIDVEIYQCPEAMGFILENPVFQVDMQRKEKLSAYSNPERLNSLVQLNYEELRKLGKYPPVVNCTSKANRYFDVEISVNIYQTNGFEVLKETNQVVLESEKDCVIRNFPLITKLRKCPIKKREQEFIQELISNTNVTKIYSNEEIEKILTKHSVLWIRLDPEIMSLRQVLEVSKEDILLEYIKLFKDPEITGQYESLKNIYYNTKNNIKSTSKNTILTTTVNSNYINSREPKEKSTKDWKDAASKDNDKDKDSIQGQQNTNTAVINYNTKNAFYNNSLIILETFIKTNQEIYFKLRIYALDLYLKMFIDLQQEENYLFLIECLEDYTSSLIKEKTCLNREVYLLMKHVIKLLGEYNEESFSDFNIIGKVKISRIQNKIIEKFLLLLLSNDFNNITGFNDCYLVREILIGCSKLYLQERTVYLLRKILQLLRIEKLKRSYNEIIIISCMEAYLNVVLKNNFFRNEMKEDTFIESLVRMINEEINYFLDSWVERIELAVFCYYYVLVLLLCKSLTLEVFVKELTKFIGINDTVKQQINSHRDFFSFSNKDDDVNSQSAFNLEAVLVEDFLIVEASKGKKQQLDSSSTRMVIDSEKGGESEMKNNQTTSKEKKRDKSSNKDYFKEKQNNTSLNPNNNSKQEQNKSCFEHESAFVKPGSETICCSDTGNLEVETLAVKLTAILILLKNSVNIIRILTQKSVNHNNNNNSSSEIIMSNKTNEPFLGSNSSLNNSKFPFKLDNPLLVLIKQLLSSRFLQYRVDLKIAFIEVLKLYTEEKPFNNNQKTNDTIIENLSSLLSSNTTSSSSYSEFPRFLKDYSSKLDFSSTKYADEFWLQDYINNEKQENKNLTNKKGFNDNDNNSDDSSQYNPNANNQHYLLKRYQLKYKDPFVLSNYNLELDKYSLNDAMSLIINKLLDHSLAEHFNYVLNEENLCELYESYMKIIASPMDLETIKQKVGNREYPTFNDFVSDVRLVFSNCREFNDKKSFLHSAGNQMEDFFNILIEPIKKINFESEQLSGLKLNLGGFISGKGMENKLQSTIEAEGNYNLGKGNNNFSFSKDFQTDEQNINAINTFNTINIPFNNQISSNIEGVNKNRIFSFRKQLDNNNKNNSDDSINSIINKNHENNDNNSEESFSKKVNSKSRKHFEEDYDEEQLKNNNEEVNEEDQIEDEGNNSNNEMNVEEKDENEGEEKEEV